MFLNFYYSITVTLGEVFTVYLSNATRPLHVLHIIECWIYFECWRRILQAF